MGAQPPAPRRRTGVVIAVIAAVVVLLLFLLPVALTLGVWTINFVRCGRQPVEATNFAAAYSYDLPGDREYSYFPILVTSYYCTEAEAKKAGYNHNPLDSP